MDDDQVRETRAAWLWREGRFDNVLFEGWDGPLVARSLILRWIWREVLFLRH